MNPKVFILLLNWNGWKDTLECLASLQQLLYDNFEVVVLDNASTNDSVARIQEAYPTIRLIETGANMGFSKGNNVGIHYALKQGADYVWLLNNDTIVDPSCLSAMLKQAEDDPRAGAIGSMLYYMDNPDRLQAWGGGRVNLWSGRPRLVTKPEPLDYISGASLLIRRKVLDTVGMLHEGYFMYWEDVDYGFILRKAGWQLAVAEKARIWHKDSSSTGRNSPRLDYYFSAALITFLKRHAPIPAIPLFLSLFRRVLLRLLRGEWARARAVVEGTFAKN